MIETRCLSRNFYSNKSRILACDDVSITVDRGEIFGLIGESGSGKSTLANMLLLLLKPCEGEIWFEGRNITALKKRRDIFNVRRKIQYVPQNSASSLNPYMTLENIITEPLKNFGLPHKGEAARLLELVGLSGQWVKRRPAKLSGGQRQRVAIARAISIEPEVLVLDEVTSNLDISTAESIISLLTDINKKLNTTMFFISHDIALAERFCGQKGVMKDGKIVEITRDLTKAKKAYTRQLVSASQTI